jgi:UDP-N-acetylmuramoylalanine--D-glutamate ligase
MKIALLGYGKQNHSAYDYWNKPENEITICAKFRPPDLPSNVKTQLAGAYLDDLHKFDLLVRTPILHPKEILQNNDLHPQVMNKVTTVTNEFFRVCPAPIIGVTGTKGKGTTSSLIAEILKHAGRRVHLGGNIGIPPLDLLKNNIQPDDIVVLELASFQLIDLKYSPHIAVCLMVEPEHLDWHTDMKEYIDSKRQLFMHQQTNDLTVFNVDSLYSEEIADGSPGIKLTYQVPPEGKDPDETQGAYVKDDHIYMFDEKICHIGDVALLGRHNLENVCAAIAATWELIGQNKEIIKEVVKSFVGLPHRIELVREVNKVRYYNDSFASAPAATIAALKAVKGPKVMIIGGLDRGLDFSELAEVAVEHQKDIRKVILIGESKKRIADTLQKYHFTNFGVLEVQDMPTIVATAQTLAQPGDAIVLSPGCASFDMFKNFEDRGDKFKAAVNAL